MQSLGAQLVVSKQSAEGGLPSSEAHLMCRYAGDVDTYYYFAYDYYDADEFGIGQIDVQDCTYRAPVVISDLILSIGARGTCAVSRALDLDDTGAVSSPRLLQTYLSTCAYKVLPAEAWPSLGFPVGTAGYLSKVGYPWTFVTLSTPCEWSYFEPRDFLPSAGVYVPQLCVHGQA